MTPYDFIDGFRIGESGYWEPLPCQMCNGQKVVSRKLTSGPLRTRI